MTKHAGGTDTFPQAALPARKRLSGKVSVLRSNERTFAPSPILLLLRNTDSPPNKFTPRTTTFAEDCPCHTGMPDGSAPHCKAASGTRVFNEGQISMPAIQAVMNAAKAPPTSERRPYLAKSLRRSGARLPMPPIITAIEPKLAKPHNA